jgi:uncharacterized protein YjbI with pentapeptide repeats
MDSREFLQLYAEGRRHFSGVKISDFLPVIGEIGANLENAYLANIYLENADLTDANLRGAILTNANLRGTNLTKAELEGANLSNVKQIKEEDDFDICGFRRGIQKSQVESEEVIINLSSAKLNYADLTGADLTGADLTDADLTGANLTGAILKSVVLQNAILEETNFRNCVLNGINLSGIKASYVDFSQADLTDADLTGIDLTNANLNAAILESAKLINAILHDADLSEANLFGTDLTGADLTGINLNRANISDTIFGNQKGFESLQQNNQELEEVQQSLEALTQENIELTRQIKFLQSRLQEQSRRQRFNQIHQWNYFYFRSPAEVEIAKALDRAGVLFYPNNKCRLAADQVNKESDFLVFHAGKFGILEVDGRTYHKIAADDHERDRLFKRYGIRVIERFDANRCSNEPDEVVRQFLEILT